MIYFWGNGTPPTDTAHQNWTIYNLTVQPWSGCFTNNWLSHCSLCGRHNRTAEWSQRRTRGENLGLVLTAARTCPRWWTRGHCHGRFHVCSEGGPATCTKTGSWCLVQRPSWWWLGLHMSAGNKVSLINLLFVAWSTVHISLLLYIMLSVVVQNHFNSRQLSWMQNLLVFWTRL